MLRGSKHEDAGFIVDKVVFNKVIAKRMLFFVQIFFLICCLPSVFLLSHMFYCHIKVKEGLGGNVRLILSGAAPLATHVEEFLRVVSCAHVLQGYGMHCCMNALFSLY